MEMDPTSGKRTIQFHHVLVYVRELARMSLPENRKFLDYGEHALARQQQGWRGLSRVFGFQKVRSAFAACFSFFAENRCEDAGGRKSDGLAISWDCQEGNAGSSRIVTLTKCHIGGRNGLWRINRWSA
jgi:hypothetical protein